MAVYSEFEIRAGFHITAEEIVHMAELLVFGREPEPTSDRYKKRWRKKNKSHATELDVEIENRVLAIVRRNFPGVPILTEEQYPTIPDADIFISLDPLDGTSTFEAGGKEWGISLGLIAYGEPVGGLVMQPALRHAIAGLKTSGVQKYDYGRLKWSDLRPANSRHSQIGSDLGPNSPPEYWEEVQRYVVKTNQRPRNLPAVAGGMEVLMGIIHGSWSHTFHHWDVAGLCALIKEMGGAVECIDGSPIPWTSVTKMPPMLVAESPEWAERIRALISKPEANQLRLATK